MRIIAVALVVLVGHVSHAAEPTYTIKIKHVPAVGMTVLKKSIEKETGSMKFYDADGKLKFEEGPEDAQYEFRTTVLERDKNGKDTHVLRTYSKARKTVGGKETILSYEGATLLFEKRATGWHLGVAGTAKITPKDAEDLLDNFSNRDRDLQLEANLAPKHPVKVGDEWTLDTKAVLQSMASTTLNLAQTSFKAKLTKVVLKEQVPFGVIELDCTLRIKKTTGLIYEPAAQHRITSTLTVALDGHSLASTRVSKDSYVGKARSSAPGSQGHVESNYVTHTTLDVSAEKDDPEARKVPAVTWLAGADVWQEFVSKDHEFNVLFPGPPKVAQETVRKRVSTQYAVEQGPNVAYLVAVMEIRQDAPLALDLDEMLAAMNKGSTVQSKSVIKLNGFPGREVHLQSGTKDKPILTGQRVYLVNNRVYFVIYTETEGKKGDMKKFFESFRLATKAADKGK